MRQCASGYVLVQLANKVAGVVGCISSIHSGQPLIPCTMPLVGNNVLEYALRSLLVNYRASELESDPALRLRGDAMQKQGAAIKKPCWQPHRARWMSSVVAAEKLSVKNSPF